RLGLIERLAHLLEALALFVELGQRELGLTVTLSLRESTNLGGGFVDLPLIGKNGGVLDADHSLVGIFLQSGVGFAQGAGKIFRLAIGIDGLNDALLGGFGSERAHLLECIEGLRPLLGAAGEN